MIVNGWKLLVWSGLYIRLNKLLEKAEQIKQSNPAKYQFHPEVKLLARIYRLMKETIPSDPNRVEYSLKFHKNWKRAKEGLKRYRLFFWLEKFHGIETRETKGDIIYTWLNDEKTLRKDGAKSDPYPTFQKLTQKTIPSSYNDLKKQSKNFPEDQS